MKKFLSLLICLCLFLSAIPALAEDVFIEIDSLKYDEYMRGETIFISGSTNAYVSLGLYYPEHYGSTAKYVMTYSPDELSEGIEIELGTEENLWPEGLWTIIIQRGDVVESLEFTLSETVDRTEEPTEDETEKPTKPSGGTIQVTPIIPEKTDITLKKGKSTTVEIDTTASSLTVEIEDEDVLSASLSGNTLKITALKKGNSDIWLRTSNNYAAIHVTVTAPTGGGGDRTEEPTEAPTEEATEPVTEAPTEESTEAPTEEKTELDTAIENPFTDLPDNHWAKDSILMLYSKGIINGMDSDTFAPDDFVTRAQFVTMLTKAFDLDSPIPLSPFGDVSSSDWFFPSVMAAYEYGITTGDSENNFNPSTLVTRQDMATFAYRTLTGAGNNMTMGDVPLFADHDLISSYAVFPVYSMKSAGIIKGMTNDTFEPLGNATRAQAAHIIALMLEFR